MLDRIANADGYEIEITPEMIEAGASAICGMELAFAKEEFWAEEIFKAMISLSSLRGDLSRTR